MPKAERKTIKSIQLELFTTFVANDPSDVSNTISVWESIPKYFFTPQQIKRLRKAEGLANPFEWEYTQAGQHFHITIQPATLKEGDKYVSYFPSASEELMEEVLKKLFTVDGQGHHDPKESESWVTFTIRQIFRELKSRGRERNLNQIKTSLDIMNRCHITVRREGKEVYSGPVLGELVKIDRDEYLENTEARWAARLPAILSMAINRADYRQFNYGRLFDFNDQLSRWIYKKMVHKYTFASLMQEYHFMYSDLKENSGLCQAQSEQMNRRKVVRALKELQKRGAIIRYEVDEKREGNKIVDVKYTITASPEFVSEQKAANKRVKDARVRYLDVTGKQLGQG
jgi:hypothetical protein